MAADFSKRPRAVMCHICGRQYGTASISIHLKSCAASFLAEEAKKPAHMRRPLPNAPTEIASVPLGKTRGTNIDAYNEAAYASFKSGALAECEHCGRRFNSDRLAVHQRSCTSDSPARRIGESLPGGGGGAMRGKTPESDDEDFDAYARPQTAPSAATSKTPTKSVIPVGSRSGMHTATADSMPSSTLRPNTSAGIRRVGSVGGAADDSVRTAMPATRQATAKLIHARDAEYAVEEAAEAPPVIKHSHSNAKMLASTADIFLEEIDSVRDMLLNALERLGQLEAKAIAMYRQSEADAAGGVP